MNEISGYIEQEEIYKNEQTIIYRALSADDHSPVIMKTSFDPSPSLEQINTIRKEYSIIRSLRINGVIRAKELVYHLNRPILVMEDIGGVSLDQVLRKKRLSLNLFMKLAVRISHILNEIHDAGIVHGAISPANIIWNAKSGELRVIDFDCSFWLPSSILPAGSIPDQSTEEESDLEKIPPYEYISPEQSRRIDAPLDFRSDYYSLGVTLYELLMGFPPFQGRDGQNILHQHLTKPPLNPTRVNEDIPEVLSEIILKLLAKKPDNRYRSGNGLLSDLEECLARITATGHIPAFPIAENDTSTQLRFSDRLYGRESLLQEASEYLCQQDHQGSGSEQRFILSVRGIAGSGKTAFVRALTRSCSIPPSHFLFVRFHQDEKGGLAGAISSAIENYLNRVKDEPGDAIAVLWEALASGTDKSYVYLARQIPRFRTITAFWSEEEDQFHNSGESGNRFIQAVSDFLKLVSQTFKPFYIILDDIHYADGLSRAIAEIYINEMIPQGSRVIMSSRWQDVSLHPDTPPGNVIHLSEKSYQRTKHIHLDLLSRQNVIELLRDLFQNNQDEIIPLATLVHDRTGGNPLFIRQFLEATHEAGLLRYNRIFRRWIWDLNEIQKTEYSENVHEFMVNRLMHLPPLLRDCLVSASVLGQSFEIPLLARMCKMSIEQTLNTIKQAVDEGLVLVSSSVHNNALEGNTDAEAQEKESLYSFSHNRLREAIYTGVSSDTRQKQHFLAGHALLETALEGSGAPDLREGIYEIVNHLNLSTPVYLSQTGVHSLLEFNLIAARTSRDAYDYETSSHYYENALDLMQKTDSSDFSVEVENAKVSGEEIFIEAAHVYALAGKDSHTLEELIHRVLENSRSFDNRLRVMEIQVMHYRFTNRLMDALRGYLIILNLFGENISIDTDERLALEIFDSWRVKNSSSEVLWSLLGELSTEQDQEKTENDSLHFQNEIRIMSDAASVAFLISPALYTVIVVRTIEKLQKYKRSEYGYLAIMRMVILLNGYTLNAQLAGEIGAQIVKHQYMIQKSSIVHRIGIIYNDLVRPWSEPVHSIIDDLLDLHRDALGSGDFHLGYLALYSAYNHALYSGKNYREIEAELSDSLLKMASTKSAPIESYIQLIRQAISAMCSPGSHTFELPEEAIESQLRQGNFAFLVEHTQSFLASHFADFQKAYDHCIRATEYRSSARSMVNGIRQVYYDSLSHIAVLDRQSPQMHSSIRERIGKNQDALKSRAENAPENFLHLYMHIEAELTASEGRILHTMNLFDHAINLADENGFTADSALIGHRAAMFYLALDRKKIARTYLEDSIARYRILGAANVISHIYQLYSSLLVPIVEKNNRGTGFQYPAGRIEPENFIEDFRSIIQASTVLLGGQDPAQVIRKILGIILKLTGGRKTVMVLESNGQWLVEAEMDFHSNSERFLHGLSLDKAGRSGRIPVSILKYTLQTGEIVIYAEKEDGWTSSSDRYLSTVNPESLMCLPFRKDSKIMGALYLENDLTAGIFHRNRSTILEMMADQLHELLVEARHVYRTNSIRTGKARQMLGGKLQRELNTNTVVFSEIRNFDRISNGMNADSFYQYTNNHLAKMEPIIRSNNGYIDRFVGDAILAIFAGSADDALQAAISMGKKSNREHRMNESDSSLQSTEKHTGHTDSGTEQESVRPRMGIGIHLALIHGEESRNTENGKTQMLDWLHQSESIKELTRVFNVDVIVSAPVLFELQDVTVYSIRFIGPLYFRAAEESLSLYEVFDCNDDLVYDRKVETLETFDSAMNRFIAGSYEEARLLFASVLEQNPGDGVARYYMDRCIEIDKEGLPVSWPGVELPVDGG